MALKQLNMAKTCMASFCWLLGFLVGLLVVGVLLSLTQTAPTMFKLFKMIGITGLPSKPVEAKADVTAASPLKA